MKSFTNHLRALTLFFVVSCCSIVATANINITVNPNCACFGQCNGSVDATVSGTFPPFSYSWSNGVTTEDLTNVCPGTYILTVTDAQGQVKQKVAVVCEYEPLIVDVNVPDKFICFGSCVGVAYAEPSGGTAPYTYHWNYNNATSSSLEELCAGLYCVTVTDAHGCTTSGCGAIVYLPELTASIEPTNPLCAESCDGSIDLTPIGGTPPYTYHWNDGTSTEDRSGLCEGSYCVTITDSEGCTYSICTNLEDPPSLELSYISANPTCHDFCNGSIDLGVAGGTSPYSYHWSNNASIQDLTELCAGQYCVTVYDSHQCSASACVTLTEPELLTADASKTNVTCYGYCNGSASVVAAGGTAPYSYHWSNGGSSSSINELCVGQYCVTVTDANGCTATDCVKVSGPPLLTADASGNNVTCYGYCNGSTSVVADGGTAPYSYHWSNGSSSSSINELCAGEYCVTVTDAHGCTTADCVTITEPEQLTADASGNNVTCYGYCNGSASVVADGGTVPYSYHWSNGSSSSSINELCAGEYCVTVTDAHGCTAADCVTITEPEQLTADASGNNVTCYGYCNGSASIVVDGGTAPYSYQWSNGSSSSSINELCPNTYCVTVTDANGCTATDCIEITQPPLLEVSAEPTSPLCFEGCNGSANATASGGTPPYSYHWSNGAETEDIFGLCSGEYCVTVTDANGCTATTCVTVNNPLLLTVDVTGINPLCPGSCDGSATATPSGGTPPYTYNWNNGGTGSTINDLCGGEYCVTVTDANGCTATGCTTIENPPNLVCDVRIIKPTCYGYCDGSIIVHTNFGTPPYTYIWSTGATSSTITGLCAGVYCVTTTDANGCSKVRCLTVQDPPELIISTSSDDVNCYGACDGSAGVNASGGRAPYTYLWSNGATTSSLSGLCAGEYCVTVTDRKGCTKTACVNITQPPLLEVSAEPTSPLCFEGCNGSANATASGGTPPYSYHWSSGAETEDIFGLCSGEYCVTVTDANGCTATTCVTVNNPLLLTVDVTGINPLCPGSCDGSATATPSGGTPPYTYNWNNGGTGSTINDLCGGEYCVTVTDANGCTATGCTTIENPPNLVCDVRIIKPTCYGYCDGSIIVHTNFGTPPYTYIWSTGATSSTITGLCAGVYCVTTTDANGCSKVRCLTVQDPPELIISTSSDDVNCYGACDGSAGVNASGGRAPYTYLWSNGATTSSLSGLCAGEYCVTVTDRKGCTKTTCVNIGQASPLQVDISATPDFCETTNCEGAVDLAVSGGTPPYTYSWSNGATTEDVSGLCTPGPYSVTVTDANGCTYVAMDVLPPCLPVCDITVGVSGIDPLCPNSCDGSASVVANGGTPPYSYHWNNGGTGSTISNLCQGEYCVTVTDANGCPATGCTTIENPSNLVCDVRIIKPRCYGDCNGEIHVTTNFGTPPYTYIWDNGATAPNLTGLCAGRYCVTTTDSHGCSKVRCMTVKNPPLLELDANAVCSTSGACNGSIDLTVNGGIPPYTFNWSNGASTEDISGLCGDISYSVTVTDRHDCTTTLTEFVCSDLPPCEELSALCSGSDGDCESNEIGTASVSVSGGTGSYSYVWNTGEVSESINVTETGEYCVTVTDVNSGCTTTCCTNVVITPCEECGGFRTQTQGGWGQCQVNGGNPGTYLYNNFDAAFPNDLVIGQGCTYTLTFTNSTGVCEFLPSGSTPETLTQSWVDPGSALNNVFAGQVATLAVSLGFDAYDADFGESESLLADQVINQGDFAGWTVQEAFDEAVNALTGCGSSYSNSDLNEVISSINENYDDGLEDHGFLSCPENARFADNSHIDKNDVIVKTSPNPFYAEFTLEFNSSSNATVTIEIYDLSGKLVTYIAKANSGMSIGNDLPVGGYIGKLTQGNQEEHFRVIKVK